MKTTIPDTILADPAVQPARLKEEGRRMKEPCKTDEIYAIGDVPTAFATGDWEAFPIQIKGKLQYFGIIANGGRITDVPVNVPNRSPKEQEANAKLMASAPKLFEACREIWCALDEWATEREPTLEEIASLREKAQHAILKATI